jgi:hypothetical protein
MYKYSVLVIMPRLNCTQVETRLCIGGPLPRTLQENPIYVFFSWELGGLSLNFHIHVSVTDLYIPGFHIFFCSRIGRPILEIYKSLTDTVYECRNWETEHYTSVLEITVSFLEIHKWEPDIYIGFSSALHLQ